MMWKRVFVKNTLRLGLLLLLLSLAACGGAASPGAEAGAGRPGKLVKFRGGFYYAISAQELAEMLQSDDPYLVNVHIPYEGEIEPTDAFIPFSEVEKHLDQLPSDKNAAIVLYCRSGVMSADAVHVLARLGYTGLYDLKGGMNAWKAAGYQVVIKPH